MAEWTINPDIDFIETTDGIKLTIPDDTPIGTNITVTYKDGKCTTSTTITVECITCEPERDTDFEGCIDWFAHDCLNIEIEYTGDTKCTYQYLWYAWKYITEHNSSLDEDVREVAVGWFMANVFSELVPEPKTVTKFMRRGTGTAVELGQSNYSPWGGIPALTSKTQSVYEKEVAIYQARIDSAAIFAQFKHETYIEYKGLITKARKELFNLGISGAKKNQTTFEELHTVRSNPNAYNVADYVPDAYKKYVPSVPSQPTSSYSGNESYETYDGTLMYGLNAQYHYLDSDDLKYRYDYGYLPLYDKRHTPCYARKIYNIDLENSACNRKFDEFVGTRTGDDVYGCEEVEYLTSNYAKIRAGRWRPATCTVGPDDREIVFLCDDTVEQGYAGQVCADETPSRCNEQQDFVTGNTSYPSGHASWGYTVALLSILYDGNKQCEINTKEGVFMSRSERGVLYGNHRYIVKAHWPTDVLIGQVIASSCIGYLMGFTEFESKFNRIYPQCNGSGPTPPPTPSTCENENKASFTYEIGGFGDCNCMDAKYDKLELHCPFVNQEEGGCKEADRDRSPVIIIHNNGAHSPVHFTINPDNVDCALYEKNGSTKGELIGTSGDIETDKEYILFKKALNPGEELTTTITLCDDSGKRVLYYKWCYSRH